MISTLPSYDDELLNSAYANISLIADKAWTYEKEDLFQKLNQSLWVQSYKVSTKYKENENYDTKKVRDVIPDSYLAKYGNYEYDETRENMYKPLESNTETITLGNFSWTEVTEPWMLPEVEKHFTRIMSRATQTNREFSTVREQESEPGVKRTGSCFQENWNDSLRIKQATKRSNGKKKLGNNHEAQSIYKTKENGAELREKCDVDDECYERHHRRYSIENSAEMQLHIRITCDAVRSLWDLMNNRQFDQLGMHLQCCQRRQHIDRQESNFQPRDRQQQLYCTFQYQPLILRAEYQSARTEAYGFTRKPLTPVLSPEVSEFFPKVPVPRFNSNKDYNGNRMQYFPSLNERSYQNELFPYNKPHENIGTIYQNVGLPMLHAPDSSGFIRAPQQWFQRVPTPTQIQISTSSSTPMCPSIPPLRANTIAHHPLQVHEKFMPSMQSNATPIPVYQRPIELYQDTTQKRKSQGVDFKNLILLTKNAMKTHCRGQSKSSQQKSSYALESKNRNAKRQVLQWLDKNSRLKPKEFVAVNTLVSELRSFEEKVDYGRTSGLEHTKTPERTSAKSRMRIKDTNIKSNNETDETDTRTRRRLYRDVLANVSTNDVPENVFDKRYDELEQQAMEQYRNSEESLALKYQELERQAMEQYKYCGGIHEAGTSTYIPGSAKEMHERVTTSKQQDCKDGEKCSGYGGCSPVNQGEGTKKGPHLQTQSTLSKGDNKFRTNVANRTPCNKSARSTITSKSRTTLTQKVSYRSKNTTKGASGDEIDERVRGSSKRRLILMSPFERKSEARLMRTTDLEEFYCISQTRKNIFNHYEDPKIRNADGGRGDENITIMQSPRTEVWLSGFWTT